MARVPSLLDLAIDKHKTLFGEDPVMVTVNQNWHKRYSSYFNGKVNVLCCGKGMQYRGIVLIFTASPLVDDFLLAY